MQIKPKEMLFGQPILQIRKIIRFAMQGYLVGAKKQIIIIEIARLLNEPINVTKNLFKVMLEEDYLELKKEKFWDKFQWKVSETEKGRRLGVTNANPSISREKADQLLKELLERVENVNNQDLCFKVQSIKIFGSYLTEQSILGDLDIAFKLITNGSQEDFGKKRQERINLALKNGRRFYTFLEEVGWPEMEVLMLLKTKKKGLSLHNEDLDEIIKRTNCRLVYEYKK